jgi:hypothetical protein
VEPVANFKNINGFLAKKMAGNYTFSLKPIQPGITGQLEFGKESIRL